MKFTIIFWSVFVLNLVAGIILMNILPFESGGEKKGFIISIIVLYLACYGILSLYTRFGLWVIGRGERKNPYSDGVGMAKISVYGVLGIALFGAVNIVIFSIPKAFTENDFMRLNGFSMASGLIFGGIKSMLLIRKYNKIKR